VRTFAKLAVTLSLCVSGVFAVGTAQPQGTWKLRSQRVIAGNPPAFRAGLVMRWDSAGKLVQLDHPVPASVIGHDRMKFSVSSNGRVLTQETRGADEKTGKAYRYVLTWDRQ
jgi:hypothetical protein